MKIFISHSSTDKTFVSTLKEDLKANGFQTWVDEDELDLGDTLANKLEIALEQSSHFLVVLTPSSVNSDWVKFELQKAFKQKDSFLLKKIIPIKYMDCIIPKELERLLYADLSQHTRRIQGNKVFFPSDGYDKFLVKLCKTIRNSDQSLTVTDKSILKKEIVNKIDKRNSIN